MYNVYAYLYVNNVLKRRVYTICVDILITLGKADWLNKTCKRSLSYLVVIEDDQMIKFWKILHESCE